MKSIGSTFATTNVKIEQFHVHIATFAIKFVKGKISILGVGVHKE